MLHCDTVDDMPPTDSPPDIPSCKTHAANVSYGVSDMDLRGAGIQTYLLAVRHTLLTYGVSYTHGVSHRGGTAGTGGGGLPRALCCGERASERLPL